MKEMLALFGARRVHKHTKTILESSFPDNARLTFFITIKQLFFVMNYIIHVIPSTLLT
jgi:hypothetical protein